MTLFAPARLEKSIMRGRSLNPADTPFARWLAVSINERETSLRAVGAKADLTHSRLSRYIGGAIPPRASIERIARALVPSGLDKESQDEAYRRILNSGLRAAGFLPEEEDGKIVYGPFLEQIREAGVIEDLPPETQAEILDYLRFKSQQAQRKRDGE